MRRGTFVHHARAYYARTVPLERFIVDEVSFRLFDAISGINGEMLMKWHDLRAGHPPMPCLSIFDDAWHMLAFLDDLVAALDERDSQNMTPAEFCDLLTRLGFVDRTPTYRGQYRDDE